MATKPIQRSGLYEMSEERYHADPCAEPSASASILTTIATKTPRHAWCEHPRLNPDYQPVERGDFDIGTAAHDLLLEGRDRIVVVDADNWRTAGARQIRDDARKKGLLPLLEKDWQAVSAMVNAARDQLAAHQSPDLVALAPGAFPGAETTVIWKDKGLYCRARPDTLDVENEIIRDYKTTAGSAHPDSWNRNHLWPGPAIQCAWYKHGIRKAANWKRPRFQWIVQETKAPYALSVLELTPHAAGLADRMMLQAWELWRRCMETDRWPGYPAVVAYVDAPGFVEYQHEERTIREDAMKSGGQDVFEMMNQWQAP